MCGTATGWAKMAFVCLFLAMILHIVGWATLNWMIYETSGNVITANIGLWRQKSCSSGVCNEQSTTDQFVNSDFNGVRALETIVFCLLVFGTVLCGVYIFVEAARRQSVAVVLMILCFIAGTLSCIGMIIFLVTIPSPFIVSWSLGLTVIAFILVLIAGTLLIPDAFEPQDYYMRRSDLVTPYTPPPDRHGALTPISYRDNYPNYGNGNGRHW
ncbi:uncharacterized protein [Littorina saxatilis]|uniref:Uncharacterized protein n=1 Tax=Littorina saxatilis TaxID=31220 RepID=A0AAN9C8J6_9CAEN